MLTILGYYRGKRDLTFPFTGWKDQKFIDLSEETPGKRLFRAILEKDTRHLASLLETPARDYRDPKTGRTGLMIASKLANVAIIKMILASNVKLNQKCSEGKNELVYLLETPNRDEKEVLECCEALEKAGVDLDSLDNNGISVLSHSIRNSKYLPTLFLLDKGCSPDVPDTDGWTSTFYAAYTGNISLCQILKDYNAAFNIVDYRGRSPFEIARSRFHREAAEILYSQLPTIDDIIEKKKRFFLSQLEYKMDQLPDASKGRNYGYQEDLLRLVDRLGLQFMTRIVLENNLQLADFLTTTDSQLVSLGVWLSQDRKKILNSIRSLHSHPWAKTAILSSDLTEPLDQVNALSNILYQLHVMSSTIVYFKDNFTESSQDLTFLSNKSLEVTELLIGEFIDVIKVAQVIEDTFSVTPCDYIGPPKQESHFRKYFIGSLYICLAYNIGFVPLLENVLMNSLLPRF